MIYVTVQVSWISNEIYFYLRLLKRWTGSWVCENFGRMTRGTLQHQIIATFLCPREMIPPASPPPPKTPRRQAPPGLSSNPFWQLSFYTAFSAVAFYQTFHITSPFFLHFPRSHPQKYDSTQGWTSFSFKIVPVSPRNFFSTSRYLLSHLSALLLIFSRNKWAPTNKYFNYWTGSRCKLRSHQGSDIRKMAVSITICVPRFEKRAIFTRISDELSLKKRMFLHFFSRIWR